MYFEFLELCLSSFTNPSFTSVLLSLCQSTTKPLLRVATIFFGRNISERRDQTIIGVWNSNIFSLSETINTYFHRSIFRLHIIFRCRFANPHPNSANKGVNYFAFIVGTSVEEETSQPSIIVWLSMEYGIVKHSVFLQLFLFSSSNHSFASLSLPNL